MTFMYRQIFFDYQVEVFFDSSASSRPFKAHVDGVYFGSFASFDVALEFARELCYSLHECSLLERG